MTATEGGGSRDGVRPSLGRRVVVSATASGFAHWSSLAVMMVRAVVLARWLPVEVFGTYALALAVIGVTSVVAEFGLTGAFLHRCEETEDEQRAAANYLSLKLILITAHTLVLVVGALIFAHDDLRLALLVLAAAGVVTDVTRVPTVMLMRRVVHRRLALLKVTDAIVGSGLALALAWSGAGLWALLSTNVTTAVLSVLLLVLWRPVWRLRLGWSAEVIRYLLSFGGRHFLAQVLDRLLLRVDNLWVGAVLGAEALGFYSRAYAFASYPRRILAVPVNNVAFGVYAELSERRRELSQAVSRVLGFLLRGGFLLGGLAALAAPEFVLLALGERWLPLLVPFRLLLVYALLDPLLASAGQLVVSVGRPGAMVRIRSLQLAVLAAGIWGLGHHFGIAGVAAAVNGSLAVGLILLTRELVRHVDLSPRQLVAAPIVALAAALALGVAAGALPGPTASAWWTGAAKVVAFTTVYLGVLAGIEGRQLLALLAELRRIRRSGGPEVPERA